VAETPGEALSENATRGAYLTGGLGTGRFRLGDEVWMRNFDIGLPWRPGRDRVNSRNRT
jgi:hypothetical protein